MIGVDLRDPHEQYKLIEAVGRIKRVGGSVDLPPEAAVIVAAKPVRSST